MNAEYCKSVKEGLIGDNGIIKLDFIKNSKYPQMLASDFGKATPKLSSKQARSFYDAVNKVYLDVISKRLSMEEAIVELTMLSSRVNDKLNKGSVPVEFKEFIEMNVEAVRDVNSLKAFVLHFEAIYNNLKDSSGAPHANGAPRGNNQKTGNFKGNNSQNTYGGKKRW